MQSQDKQLLELIAQVKKISTPNAKIATITQYLQAKATSSRHQDCLIVEKILGYSDADSDGSLPALSARETAEVIVRSLKSIQSVSILMALYAAWEKCRRTASHDIDWRLEYERKRSEGFLASFNKWIQHTTYSDAVLCNQVLSRVLAGLPNFLQYEKVRSTYPQFQSCLIWLSIFTIRTRDDHLCALRAARLVKEVTDIRVSDYEKKEHLILRKVVELLGDNERRNNSLYLFFDRFTLRTEDIEYFINIREDFFEELDEKHLCNVFLALVQAGVNHQILAFLRKVSALLKSNDQYFILRTLFEQVILPIVAAKFKTHRKLGQDIFQFVLYYIAGFLAHCFVGEDGLECLLQNLQDVEDKTLRKKWAELAVLCCKEDPKLKATTEKHIQKAKLSKVSSDNLMAHINKQGMVWVVTMHNGRKLKKYPEIESLRFRGIQNLDNQCYIISVVQALYCTEEFRKLILHVHPEAKEQNLKVLKQFRQIFEGDLNVQLKERKATVKYLKNLGPEQFRSTQRQEDSQQYLCKLFEYLEYELKKTGKGMEEFQSIFRAQFAIKIACGECKIERELPEHQTQYVNTYSTKEHFQLKREEPLDENYKCQKCGTKKKSVKITTLINKPRILILHINRFRTTQKGVNKILGNYPIRRSIGDYHLVGFIVHKGSSINAGHYLYYARVEETRWALFNDSKVTEFNIAKEEQFEREFRAQNSPYILFYKPSALLK